MSCDTLFYFSISLFTAWFIVESSLLCSKIKTTKSLTPSQYPPLPPQKAALDSKALCSSLNRTRYISDTHFTKKTGFKYEYWYWINLFIWSYMFLITSVITIHILSVNLPQAFLRLQPSQVLSMTVHFSSLSPFLMAHHHFSHLKVQHNTRLPSKAALSTIFQNSKKW